MPIAKRYWVLAGFGVVFRLTSAVADSEISSDIDTVIVTGTRDRGLKQTDSPSPVNVLGSETLRDTGQNTLFDALKDVLPSFSAAAQNFDTSAMIRSARLRGLNPGEVLVLVNGKRRHTSANVNADQTPDVSSNPPDLDMIPLSLIDHVEVLEDGAAAQYGSDAVAGVINIILKKADHGGSAAAGAGVTTRGDGFQGDAGVMKGVALGQGGFLDVSFDYRHHDYMNRSGIDRVNIGQPGQTEEPIRNRLFGAPLSDIETLGFNAELPVTDRITLYGFGTAGRRTAAAYENDRSGVAAPTIWPLGFFPQETIEEVDGAVTAGVKGSGFWGWDWDLSTVWGRDSDDVGVKDTVNFALDNPPGYARGGGPGLGLNGPTRVYAGTEANTQWTTNFDARRPIEIAAMQINLAFGAEFRHETYQVTPGQLESYELGGTAAHQGFTPQDAVRASRDVEAGYVDLSAKIIPRWRVDLAGRIANYTGSGGGSTANGKLATRFEIDPAVALRVSIGNGFHAPTLAQNNFSATSISVNADGGSTYYIQLPLSSPGARVLGAPPLVPETSQDVDFGVVATPFANLRMTLDAYQIFLDHRIINSGTLSGPMALGAAAANGNYVPPGSVAYVQFFNNGVDTRTRGLDLSVDYSSDLDDWGAIKWTLLGNRNLNSVTRLYAIPPALLAALNAAGSAPTYVTPDVLTDLTKATPPYKISLAANYVLGDVDVTLRNTLYGRTDINMGSYSVVPYANVYTHPAVITDLDLGVLLADGLRFEIGGTNIFDVLQRPYTRNQQSANRLSDIYSPYTPWGIQGAYFFSRLSARF